MALFRDSDFDLGFEFMLKPLFELKGVYFFYPGKIPALCGIDLTVRAGEKITIIGANGTGKSTLLLMLDGLIFPDRGTIRAFDRELKESIFNDEKFSRFFRSKVGLVFQNSEVQLFSPTVGEDILFGPLQLGLLPKIARERLNRLSETLGIKDLMDRPPHQLSVGEKRKVAIAGVLAIEPDIIIMDEPTAGLDPLTSRHIMDIIIKANESGKTIITATHDLGIIEEISDIVYVLDREKKIAKFGPPEELLKDRMFLEDNNLIHIHPHSHKDKLHTHSHEHLEHHQ